MGRDKYFVDAMASLKLRYKISYLIVRGNQSKPVSYSSECNHCWMLSYLLHFWPCLIYHSQPCLIKLWEFVDMFHTVDTVGNAESEIKVEGF